MVPPLPDAPLIARAIRLSLNAALWERHATSTADVDDSFSHRIQAEICRLRSAAALRDVGR